MSTYDQLTEQLGLAVGEITKLRADLAKAEARVKELEEQRAELNTFIRRNLGPASERTNG